MGDTSSLRDVGARLDQVLFVPALRVVRTNVPECRRRGDPKHLHSRGFARSLRKTPLQYGLAARPLVGGIRV
jgi:hypothetical protein